jgi:hypothetical protein
MLTGLQMLQTSAEAREKEINRFAKPMMYGILIILLPIITALYIVLDQELARRIAVICGMPILGGLIAYYFNHLRNNPHRIPKPEIERGTVLVNLGYLILIISTGFFAGVFRLLEIGIVSILVAIILVAAGGVVMGTVSFAGLYSKMNLGIFVTSQEGVIETAKLFQDTNETTSSRIASAILPYINVYLERVLKHGEEITIPGIYLEPLDPSRLYQVHIIPHEVDSRGLPLSALIIIADISASARELETEQISELLDKSMRERDSAEFYLDLLSHDIGNIIQGISFGAEMARNSIHDQKSIEFSLEIINDEVDRSIILLRETKLMVRTRETIPHLVEIDVTLLLQQSFLAFKKGFGKGFYE